MTSLEALLRAVREHPEEETPRMMLADELLEDYDGTLPPIPPALWFEIANRLEGLPEKVKLTEWPKIHIHPGFLPPLAVIRFEVGYLTIEEMHVFSQRVKDDPTVLESLRYTRNYSAHTPLHVLRALWPTVQFELAPTPVTLDAELAPA